MSSTNDMHWQLNEQLRFRAVGEEGVVVDQRNGNVMVVNAVGLHLLQQLRDGANLAELNASVQAEFAVERDQLEADVTRYLEELHALGAIHESVSP